MEEKFAKFAAEALRTPRMDVHMRLAARMLLSAAVCQDELQRFQFIVRAAQGMIEECKNQGFELDEALLGTVDAVARSFSLAKPVTIVDETTGNSFRVQPIPWSFPMDEESFERYIAEWWNTDLAFYTELLAECKEAWVRVCCARCGYVIADATLNDWTNNTVSEKTKNYGVVPDLTKLGSKCPNCGLEWQNESQWSRLVGVLEYGEYRPVRIVKYYRAVKEPLWLFFFDSTANALSVDGYRMLLGNFLSYYSRKIAETAAKVAKSISPTIFREVEAAVAAEKEAGGEALDESTLG
jgi:ribosomal protein S27AE